MSEENWRFCGLFNSTLSKFAAASLITDQNSFMGECQIAEIPDNKRLKSEKQCQQCLFLCTVIACVVDNYNDYFVLLGYLTNPSLISFVAIIR